MGHRYVSKGRGALSELPHFDQAAASTPYTPPFLPCFYPKKKSRGPGQSRIFALALLSRIERTVFGTQPKGGRPRRPNERSRRGKPPPPLPPPQPRGRGRAGPKRGRPGRARWGKAAATCADSPLKRGVTRALPGRAAGRFSRRGARGILAVWDTAKKNNTVLYTAKIPGLGGRVS